MKQILYFVSILFLSIFLTSFNANKNPSSIVKGEVIWEGKGCDFYIIETSQWYVLVEVYTGVLYQDDIVEGELHTYNFKNIRNISRGSKEVKVWIENYWGSKERCFEWLREHRKCGLGE